MGIIRNFISSGTYVLLEVPSIHSFVHYFQTIHSLGDSYEVLRGQISTYEITAVNRLEMKVKNDHRSIFPI